MFRIFNKYKRTAASPGRNPNMKKTATIKRQWIVGTLCDASPMAGTLGMFTRFPSMPRNLDTGVNIPSGPWGKLPWGCRCEDDGIPPLGCTGVNAPVVEADWVEVPPKVANPPWRHRLED